eukprot:Blabericola_migrator_1__11059@NODE_643_length_7105_cov_97_345553_g472_i0_p3_GENE_NODE_643_length_7105_cov_97_345553_g472_i0NODE_643_length_7105_cov_97_345553_g472_i0_p3_ORF_typecomplete_len251_score37_56_NODE_643_length_7105_cov_97_345553_g472_i057856537
MNARAVNVLVQQLQQNHEEKSKHKTTARLLFNGVVMVMTCDYCLDTTPVLIGDESEPSDTTPGPLWRVNVHNHKDVTPCHGKRCIPYLLNKNLLKRQDDGELKLLVEGRFIRRQRDLRDLLVLNQYLDMKIAEGMEKYSAPNPEDSKNWYEWALQRSHLAEQHVREAPDEATAVRRLQKLVEAKIMNVDMFKRPQWSRLDALPVFAKYDRVVSLEMWQLDHLPAELFEIYGARDLAGQPLPPREPRRRPP